MYELQITNKNKNIRRHCLSLLLVCNAGLLIACSPALSTVVNQENTAIGSLSDKQACTGDGVDQLVCESEKITKLVGLRATLKLKAESNYSVAELEVLQLVQLAWEGVNTACLTSSNPSACVQTNYRKSISDLQISTGSTEISGSANYLCIVDIHEHFTAVFYNQTELPAVVLTRELNLKDSQKVAFLVPSGSGAKYQGKDVSLWIKAEEAQLSWGEKSLSCSLQPANSGGI